MRTLLPLLGLLSFAVLAPAACGSSGGSSSNGGGDDGGVSSSGSSGSSGSSSGGMMGGNNIKTVFVILMENNNWSGIKGSSSAPYINSLLTDSEASWCSQYYNPPGNHPSEPNYVWLEAATSTFPDDNDTFTCDCNPSGSNSTASTQHLATLMTAKGVTWREYAEGISGNNCPVTSSGLYAAKHVPFLFFQDVSGNPPSASNATCKAHMAPYTQLTSDLTGGTVAQYNFLTPNLCDDMHGATGCPSDLIKAGDMWLSTEVPKIRASNAYKNGGAIFITWDEGEGGVDGPIGMIVLSPFAKGNGFQSSTHFDHSSTVKTVEEIFGLSPLIGHAADSGTKDLSELFKAFP